MKWEDAIALSSEGKIESMCRVVGEWGVFIGGQCIGIKIVENGDGKLGHRTSHFCQPAGAAYPYVSPDEWFETMEDALIDATKQLTEPYDPENPGTWTVNCGY